MGAWFFGDAASVRAQVARAGVAIFCSRAKGEGGGGEKEKEEEEEKEEKGSSVAA